MLFNLGFLFQRQERYNDARSYFRQALEISEAIDSFGLQVLVSSSLAENAWEQGDASAAAAFLRASLRLAVQKDIPKGLTLRTLLHLAQFKAHRGDYEASFLITAFVSKQKGMAKAVRTRTETFYQEISLKLLPNERKRLEQEAASLSLETILLL